MKDTYTFPAIFNYADDGISIEFPDLPGCFSCSETTEEAFKDAKEAMGLHLWGMEKDGDTIPEPSDVSNIKLKKGDVLVMIEVFMPPVRDRINNSFTKKTLSIPSWLNSIAEENNVNFSQILQQALKAYLNISEPTK